MLLGDVCLLENCLRR